MNRICNRVQTQRLIGIYSGNPMLPLTSSMTYCRLGLRDAEWMNDHEFTNDIVRQENWLPLPRRNQPDANDVIERKSTLHA